MREIIVKPGERRQLVFVHDSPESVEQVVRLSGEGAEVQVEEVFTKGNVKSRLTIVHDAPRTISRVSTRGVVDKKEASVAEATVVMPKHAQLSDSVVSQRFLLLDESAKADAKPCLEIEADEVKAAHAATVSPIDENMLFYLTSRGLPRDAAKALIIDGFLQVPK